MPGRLKHIISTICEYLLGAAAGFILLSIAFGADEYREGVAYVILSASILILLSIYVTEGVSAYFNGRRLRDKYFSKK